MARLNLTHVTAPARVGGLESVVAAVAGGLAARGHDVRLVALLGLAPEDRCEPFVELPGRGVDLREVRVPPRSYGAEVRAVARILRQAGGLAHCHGYHADLIGWRAGALSRRPLISTVHGFTGGGWKNRLYERLDRWALSRFDAVVAVSAPLREHLMAQGIGGQRVHLIPNAWPGSEPPYPRAEGRAMLGLPAEGAVVGWIGRLTEEKGPDLFVDAMAKLPPEVTASVLGDGALRASLAARAHAAGLAARIRWHGVVPRAARLLGAFDVLVLSSRTEGTPMILLEAMAAGVPVVATAVGGVPDVAPGGEVLLVRELTPEAVAAGIAQCLANPDAASARAAAARARVRTEYDLETWLDRHEALYRSLA